MRRYLSMAAALLLLSGCGSMKALNPVTWFASEEPVNPPTELVELESNLPVKILWSSSIGAGVGDERVKLVPFPAGNRVYVADSEGVVKALESANGRQLWSADLDMAISGGPGAGSGLVLLGTGDGEVVALDADSGGEKWRARVSSEVLSVPKAEHGIVIVHTIDGKLFGLDAADGSQIWIYDRTVPILTLHGSSSPVISRNRAICGFANGKLASLNLVNGVLNWEATVTSPKGRSELERMVDIDADPLVAGGIIFVASYQGDVAAVSEDTGVVLWRRALSSYTGFTADWGQVYVTDELGHTWALDPQNGSAVWRNKKLQGRRLSPPAMLGGHVAVGDFEGYLHWLTREDGRIVGRTRVGKSAITSAPLEMDGILYVYNDNGQLTALTLNRP